MTQAYDYDLIIIGGGLVGASLACALGESGLKIAMIEAVSRSAASQPSYDDRCLALAYGSRRIFEGMGLWSAIAPHAVLIKQIHISDRGHFGAARMRADEEGLAALGYVVESRQMGVVLMQALKRLPQVDQFCPASLNDVTITDHCASIEIEENGERRVLTSRLLVAADGSHSRVRHALGIKAIENDYHQSAIIANVTPTQAHHNIAYERFTDTGPLALLPMGDNRCSLVLTVETSHCDEVMALSDDAFLQHLASRFGRRLGGFTRVGQRHAYPLSLLSLREHIRERVVMIGNAAHTLHPIAGQGFNLGLRDVVTLAQVVIEASESDNDIGDLVVLKNYERWRESDRNRSIAFTDGLVRGFSNDFLPMVVARNVGLVVLDMMPPIKRVLMKHAMGRAGHLPRLACGLPLCR